MTKTLIVFSLLFTLLYGFETVSFSLPPGQSHVFTSFNQSIIHPQFVNHSCEFSTLSGESSLYVSVFKGTGYVNGYPLDELQITVNESPLFYFFDVTNTENPEFIPGLVFKNEGSNNISVTCRLFSGLDYFIPQGSEIVMQDPEYDHYPLQCRLFTLGKNVPLEVTTQGSGFISWGSHTSGYVNHLDFGYVVDGSSTTFTLKNNGNADVDLLCQNF